MVAPSLRVSATVTFGTPLVTDAWEPEEIEVSSEQMQEVKEDVINDPLTGQSIRPTLARYKTVCWRGTKGLENQKGKINLKLFFIFSSNFS